MIIAKGRVTGEDWMLIRRSTAGRGRTEGTRALVHAASSRISIEVARVEGLIRALASRSRVSIEIAWFERLVQGLIDVASCCACIDVARLGGFAPAQLSGAVYSIAGPFVFDMGSPSSKECAELAEVDGVAATFVH